MKTIHMVLVVVAALASLSGVFAENLLYNSEFEEPEGREGAVPERWSVFAEKKAAIGIVCGAGLTNSQCLKVGSVGIANSFQGIVQRVVVEEGVRYTLSALVLNNKDEPIQGSAYGQLVIEWKDGAGNEVDRTWGGEWKKSISKVRWEPVAITRVRAPKTAVEAVIGIHLYEGIHGNGKGSYFVDNVTFGREEQGASRKR